MRDLDRTVLTLERRGRGSNKRKHGENDASTKKPSVKVTAVNNTTATTSSSGVESTLHDNRLLAGYLAHEFLTKGTLFGEQYDPARAEAVPFQSAANTGRSEDSRRFHLEAKNAKKLDSQSYAEVASLFQIEGTHIPGIVNPAELARWIQL